MNQKISVAAGMAVLAAMPLAGRCVSSPPSLEPAQMVADATGLGSAIQLRVEGDRLDATGPTNATPGQLTRLDAAERALNHSPQVQAALAEVRAALADAKQARVLANPVLDLNVRFPEGGGDEVIEAGLSQSLIDLLRRPARARAAGARLRAVAARAVDEALDVLQEVEGLYAEAQAADAGLVILDEQQSLLQQLLDVSEARRQTGEAGRLEVIGFKAQQAALDAEAVRQRADRRALRLTLTRLIGQPSGAAEWELEPVSTPPLRSAAESAWIKLALENRPGVQAAVFELAALGQEVRLASLEPFEDLGIGAEVESEEALSAGPAASVPVPIFDWGQHRRARATAEVIAARHRLLALRREVVEEVRQALAAAEAAREATTTIENQVLPLQRERVEQARAAYRAGLVDVTDVLVAEQDLLEAQAQLIAARLGQQTAAAALKRAAGGVAVPPTTQPTTQPSAQAKASPLQS